MKGKYEGLLEDPSLRRWYENLMRGSPHTTDGYLRSLDLVCARFGLSPQQMVLNSKSDPQCGYGFLLDLVSGLEREGRTAG